MSSGSKETTVGYKYFLGVQLALCHGEVDKVSELIVGERSAWAGSVTTSSDVAVNAPELFGGEKSQGGVSGVMRVNMGGEGQAQDPYLVANCGAHVPAYLGLTTVVFKHFYWSAMNPYFKAPWLTVTRILKGWRGNTAWYPSKAVIGTLDMNPAHIVYQCLTDTRWGLGYSTTDIDDVSFMLCADALYAEGFGLSMIWDQQMVLQDFIQIILSHVNGTLRLDLRTGKFVLKLIRDDYTVDTLTELNASNVLELTSFQRIGWGESANEIVVKYTDRYQKEQTVVTQDLAAIEAQGTTISTTKEYLGIRDPDIAMRVAMRDLATSSAQLAKITLTCNRVLWDKAEGDVIALTWPKLGITKAVFRIVAINKGQLADGKIQIEAVEDVFSLPSNVYTDPQSSLWQDVQLPPSPSPIRRIIEVPYYEVQRNMSQADFAMTDPGSAYLGTVATKPSQVSYDYGIRIGPDYADGARGAFCATAALAANITPAQTTFSLGGSQGLSSVAVGGWAMIEDEIVRVDSLNLSTNSITVGRGCLDTTPSPHSSGAAILFAQGSIGSNGVEYAQSQLLNIKLTPRTGMGELATASAPVDAITFVGRMNKPYPPGKLRISGDESTTPSSTYPTEVHGVLSFTWAHRNRLTQNLEDESIGTIISEVGVTYTVKIYEGATLLESASGITGTSYTSGIDGVRTLRIEVESVRTGFPSFQKANHTFLHINTGRILTEAGDNIATEVGDLINKG